MSRHQQIQTTPQVQRQHIPQPEEQFLVSVTGIKIKIHGRALLILALGIAAALGAVVVVKLSLF